MDDQNERLHVLELIENGQLSVDEGLRLLQRLILGEDSPPEKPESSTPRPAIDPETTGQSPEAKKFRRWWVIPLWIGVGITTLGGILMLWTNQASVSGFWLLCATIPFVLGVSVVFLAWLSRAVPWIHLRVGQGSGNWPPRIHLIFPIPVRLGGWLLRAFGRRIPGLERTSLDEILQAAEKTTGPDNPVFIQVNNSRRAQSGSDGERVEIYIG